LQAITYWVFNDVMILKSPRHDTEEEVRDLMSLSYTLPENPPSLEKIF
jgi:hypothetical protein